MTFWAGYEGNKAVSCTAPIETDDPALDKENKEDKKKGSALSDQ